MSGALRLATLPQEQPTGVPTMTGTAPIEAFGAGGARDLSAGFTLLSGHGFFVG